MIKPLIFCSRKTGIQILLQLKRHHSAALYSLHLSLYSLLFVNPVKIGLNIICITLEGMQTTPKKKKLGLIHVTPHFRGIFYPWEKNLKKAVTKKTPWPIYNICLV